jgi:hypothetical protein
MDNENEELQKLLRLKRYESPEEGYFEQFLEDLKERQRTDGLKQSSLLVFKDRFSQWFDDMGNEKWAVPAGSFAAVALMFLVFGNGETEEQISQTKKPANLLKKNVSESNVIELTLPQSIVEDKVESAELKGENPSFLPAGL